IAADGEVSDVELYASVIRSVRRFAYEEVQGLIEVHDVRSGVGLPDGKSPRPAPEIDAALLEDILQIRAAAAALGRQRMRRGALDLDLPETQIVFDAEGRVSDLRRTERFEAHRLIEELMIAANEAVSRE